MVDMRIRAAKPIGRSLKLYLVDGTPSGVITAELGVSSLRAAVASRTALPELIRRDEASRTGIYLLIGPDPDLPGRLLVYVGEGDQVRTRLASHDADESKDFFTRAVLIVSKDENLTKAHGRYLESRLITAIRLAGRAKLTNGTEPDFRGLPEPEIADMERVLEEIDVLLPVLGFDILRPAGHEMPISEAKNPIDSSMGSPSAPNDPVFIFTESGTNARAREMGGEFVVLAGSTARKNEMTSCSYGVRQRRAQLLSDGTLVPTADGSHLKFLKDAAFDSPTGAGAAVYAGSINGRKYWRHSITKQTYGDWRDAQVDGLNL
jgi:hypothetical protein